MISFKITPDHMQLASYEEDQPFLPEEILSEIFSYLYLEDRAKCRLINRKFYVLIPEISIHHMQLAWLATFFWDPHVSPINLMGGNVILDIFSNLKQRDLANCCLLNRMFSFLAKRRHFFIKK